VTNQEVVLTEVTEEVQIDPGYVLPAVAPKMNMGAPYANRITRMVGNLTLGVRT
jgi:hypothetical protein